MARHSVSAAAKLVGLSRASLYEYWINPGKLSIGRDEKGKPYIDTTELLRCFGALKGVVADSADRHELTPADSDQTALQTQLTVAEVRLQALEQQVRDKEQELERYREREVRLLALLEWPKDREEKPVPARPWWRRLWS